MYAFDLATSFMFFKFYVFLASNLVKRFVFIFSEWHFSFRLPNRNRFSQQKAKHPNNIAIPEGKEDEVECAPGMAQGTSMSGDDFVGKGISKGTVTASQLTVSSFSSCVRTTKHKDWGERKNGEETGNRVSSKRHVAAAAALVSPGAVLRAAAAHHGTWGTPS